MPDKINQNSINSKIARLLRLTKIAKQHKQQNSTPPNTNYKIAKWHKQQNSSSKTITTKQQNSMTSKTITTKQHKFNSKIARLLITKISSKIAKGGVYQHKQHSCANSIKLLQKYMVIARCYCYSTIMLKANTAPNSIIVRHCLGGFYVIQKTS